MRPTTRCAVGLSGVVVLTLAFFLWLKPIGPGTEVAFADVQEALRQVKTAVVVRELPNAPYFNSRLLLLRDSGLFRIEYSNGMVEVMDCKEAKLLKAFNTLTGTIRQKDNQMDLVIKAFGGDAEGAAAAVQEVETSLAEGREQFARISERMPMMKPMSDLLKSIKVASDGGNATLTGHLKGDFRKMLMAPFGMFMGVSHSVREGPGGVQVENARPQPVPR